MTRLTRDVYGRLLVDGMLYMGPIRIPPLPPHIIMTDRTTGEEKALAHTGTQGSLTVDLATPNDRWPDVARFGPYEGPYLGSWRLYLSGGSLAAEAVTPEQWNGRVLTRRNFDRYSIEITVTNDGTLTYTEITL